MSYKSILDALLETIANLTLAKCRSLTPQFKDSALAKLPASSDTKIQILAQKQFILIAESIVTMVSESLLSLNSELVQQYQTTKINQYERPLTGSKGITCQKEQIKNIEEKGILIIDSQYETLGQDTLQVNIVLNQFNNFRDFLNYDKKVKNINNLTLSFKSQGLTDNNMEHFMKRFIQFYNIKSLQIDLGCNSLSTVGARQIAGCFTNLNYLNFINISLYNNKINWEGIDAIMHALKSIYSLREIAIDVSCNPLGNTGFVLIAKALSGMRKINKLWLSVYDIGINDDSFQKFLIEFEKMDPLLVLRLDFKLNPFDKKLIKQLHKILHSKKMNVYEILI